MASGGRGAVVAAAGEIVSARIAKNWGLNALHEHWFGNDSIAGTAELSPGDYDFAIAERVELLPCGGGSI